MNAFDFYMDDCKENCFYFVKEYFDEYDDFESLWDDMINDDSVTGNMSGRCCSFNVDAARAIVWEQSFIDYLEEFDYSVGKVIERGEETVDVFARFMVIEHFLWRDIANYYDEIKEEKEEASEY